MGYKDIIFEAAAKEQGLSWITVVENGETSTLSVCPASKTLDCYSVSKVFTVTALGLLCDDGMLSTEERVVDILRDLLPDGMDARWESVTVDDVIRHRWGIDHGFLDIDVEDIEEYERLYGTRDDFLRIVLSARLPLEVGSKYVYSDAAYYLLSRIITVKTGISLTELLRERQKLRLHLRKMLARQNERQKNIILQGEGIKQVEILKNETEMLTPEHRSLRILYPAYVSPVEKHLPKGRSVKRCHNVEKRGLPRPGLTHNRDILSFRHIKADVFKCRHAVSSEPCRVYLFQISYFKQIH